MAQVPIRNHYQVQLLKTKLACLAFRYIFLRDQKGDVSLLYPLGLKSLGYTVMIFVSALLPLSRNLRMSGFMGPGSSTRLHHTIHSTKS